MSILYVVLFKSSLDYAEKLPEEKRINDIVRFHDGSGKILRGKVMGKWLKADNPIPFYSIECGRDVRTVPGDQVVRQMFCLPMAVN